MKQPCIYRVPVAAGKNSVTFGTTRTVFLRTRALDLAYYVGSLKIEAIGTNPAARRDVLVRRPQPIEYINTGPAETARSTRPSR